MLNSPVSGRMLLEKVIPGKPCFGHSDQVGLVFGRRLMRAGPRPPPGRFRTRVITDGLAPSLHVGYKQCHDQAVPQGRGALRTETIINDSHDFRIGKRLANMPALREIGLTANRRLLRVQRISHDPITGTQALRPSPTQSSPPLGPDPWTAPRATTKPRTLVRVASVQAATGRVHQAGSARAHRTARWNAPRHRYRRADDP